MTMPHSLPTAADDVPLPAAAPGIVCRAVDEGAVLLALSNEVYYGLNAVGLRVWELLPPASATVGQLCAVLASEYADADPATIRTDVLELLDDLAAHGLVVRAAATLPAA